MTAPPSTNPIRWAAKKRKHWANPIEIKPGFWQVEEGSGPKAHRRRLAIVERNLYGGWVYRGWVETYGGNHAQLELWLGDRTWKLGAPSAELCPMLADLVRQYA